MDFQTSKNLGILGVLIIVFDAIVRLALAFVARLSLLELSIPNYGIVRIVGIIVILISFYHLANFYQTKTIYTNARNGVIAAIIGIILPSLIGIMPSPLPAIKLLIFLATLTIFFAIAVFFVSRSLNELSARSGVDDFAASGKWLLIGAILTIIVFGIIIMGIALLILLNAFSKLKNPKSAPSSTIEITSLHQTSPTTATTATANIQTKAYCSYCGNPTLPENTFCPHCGQHT